MAGQTGFAPRHRHVKSEQEDDDKGRQKWGCALMQQAEQVIYINHKTMIHVDDAMQKSTEKASSACQ